MIKLILIIMLLGVGTINTVQAQTSPAFSGDNKEPVEISADKTLEWRQKDKQYIADGNVEAKQGEVSILTDKLIADYRDDNEGGNVEIWQLTAEKNVILKNTDSTATGDKAVYNVDTGCRNFDWP